MMCAFLSDPTSATATLALRWSSGSGRQTTMRFRCWLGMEPACHGG